jgi:hypothetical protein
MTFRTLLASADEQRFADEVNHQVNPLGASVHVFEQVDTANNERRYGIVFSAGPQRLSMFSDSPWHIEPAGSVIVDVRRWLDAANGSDIWTTEPPDDVKRQLEHQ